MSAERVSQLLVRLGFTLILLGYLVVWLPQPIAGLSFIGLEMGEWVKFLPQVRTGEIAAGRDLFYLPPITLGLMLALWTTGWLNRRWQTWALRALAVLVALLAFPAVEAILYENYDQWLARVLLILMVVLIAVLVPQLGRLSGSTGMMISWLAMFVLAVIGFLLPTWAYLAVRPSVAMLFGRNVGIGPGVWLNAAGHILVVAVAMTELVILRRGHPAPAG